MKKRNSDSSPLEWLQDLQVLKLKLLGRWLTKHLSHAIEHLPDKEDRNKPDTEYSRIC